MKITLNKRALKVLLVFIVIAVLCVILFILMPKLLNGKVNPGGTDGPETETVYYDGKIYSPKEDLETVLIIGLDKFVGDESGDSYRNKEQADFLMLVVLDRKNGSYSSLHINRDAMSEIPVLGVFGESAGSMNGQLALAHTFGSGGKDSCVNTVNAVEEYLFGIEIDHYVAVKMDAVPILNDLVGGVTVKLLEDFTMFDPEYEKDKEIVLMGDMALNYVRARGELAEPSNLNRMERQRQYISALKPKIIDSMNSDANFPAKVLRAVSDSMLTDYTSAQISALMKKYTDYTDKGIGIIEGEAVEGKEFMEFYTDDEKLERQIIGLFYEPYEE